MSITWPTVPLGEVLRQRKEFITIDDIAIYRRPRVQLHAQGIVLRDEVPGALIKTKSQQVCRMGELLVAEIDAKVGGFGIVPDALESAIVSSHYFLFEIDETKLDRRYLDFFIRTPGFRDQVEAQGSTNYASIRPADVLAYQLPLPTVEEQRGIVAQIRELATQIDEARALRCEATEEAEALQTSARRKLIKEASGDMLALESVCTDIIDNLHSNPRLSEEGIPCVRSPDVGYGTLNLERAQRTSEDEYRHRTSRGEPRADDIVFVREGGGTGKCALVQPGQRFSIGQRVMMLRPDPTRILPAFFLHQLLSPLVQEDQIAPLSKGSASPHLNISALRKFQLKVPAVAEQGRIVAELDGIKAEVGNLKHFQAETAAELDALLPSILDRAFRGEL